MCWLWLCVQQVDPKELQNVEILKNSPYVNTGSKRTPYAQQAQKHASYIISPYRCAALCCAVVRIEGVAMRAVMPSCVVFSAFATPARLHGSLPQAPAILASARSL